MQYNPTAWTQQEKETFLARRIQDGVTRVQLLIVLHTVEAYTQPRIAEMSACSIRSVARVQQRFREHGIEGLMDGRTDNGTAKTTDDYILALIEAVRGNPFPSGLVGSRKAWERHVSFLTLPGVPSLGSNDATLLHPHRLDVDELADAHGGEFAAIAAALHAAERQTRVGLDDAVDEHRTRLDPRRQGFALPGVARP